MVKSLEAVDLLKQSSMSDAVLPFHVRRGMSARASAYFIKGKTYVKHEYVDSVSDQYCSYYLLLSVSLLDMFVQPGNRLSLVKSHGVQSEGSLPQKEPLANGGV